MGARSSANTQEKTKKDTATVITQDKQEKSTTTPTSAQEKQENNTATTPVNSEDKQEQNTTTPNTEEQGPMAPVRHFTFASQNFKEQKKCLEKLTKVMEVANKEHVEDQEEDKQSERKSFSTSVLMYNWLPLFQKRRKEEAQKQRNEGAQSPEQTSKSTESPSKSLSDAALRMNAEILVDAKQLIDVYWQPTYSKNIKLIATALILKQRDGYFKNFFGKATKISPFGTVHTAVQIGGVILDWNNSSLLIPIPASEYFNRKAIAALDMEIEAETGEDMIQKAFELVAEWNGKVDYDQSTTNCQRFTLKLFEVLGVSTKFPHEIQKFLNSLGTMQKKDLCFEFKDQRFQTHAALDEYVANNYSDVNLKDPANLTAETRLLKAYDRVFWLRYLGVQESKNLGDEEKQKLLNLYKERLHKEIDLDKEIGLSKAIELGCPFGDPKTTGTLYGAK